jgi:hypothetical protein
MAEMRASPVKSKTLKRLADIVRMAEDQGQMEFLPFNPMTLFPVSSTTLENLAYGNLPMAIPSQSNIPITKTGRKQEVAELAGLLPMVPATSRGVAQGANYLGDVMTQAVTRNPEATSMRALSEISQMSPVSQMFDPRLAKRVIPETAVVDEAGNPQFMYHGTQRAPTGIDEFGSESGYAGQETAGLSWFTSSPESASGYANWVEGAGNPTVYPVYLSIKNPASIDDYLKAVDEINKSVKGRNFVDNDPEIGMYDKRVVEKLKDKGFDGVSWTDAEYTGQTGFATDKDVTALPFSSKQIKSAISDPDIMEQFLKGK